MAEKPQLKTLEAVFATLPERVQETIQWWLVSEQFDGSAHLWGMAQLYWQEYRKTLPGTRGKIAPSHVYRELTEILTAVERLRSVLGRDLSSEAEDALRNAPNGFIFDFWLPTPGLKIPIDGQPRLNDLDDLAACIKAIPKRTKKRPANSWLIHFIAYKLKKGRKPKSHVLPIARAIHCWATKERISSEWGDEFLRGCWPPSKRRE